jgi:hypothetical protein
LFSSKNQIFPGIWQYSNVFPKEYNFISDLEDSIEKSKGLYTWEDAQVGYDEKISNYRNCKDFKLGCFEKTEKNEHIEKFDKIWKKLYDLQKIAVEDYCNYHTIKMNFQEWVNVVKYGKGQYFKEHADHGFSYVSTVSLVGYPNDDYVGGDLHFPKINFTIKPQAGDLYIFPSSYIYSHVALPVYSGTKYAFVTMLDYNDNAHTDEYEEYLTRKGKK